MSDVLTPITLSVAQYELARRAAELNIHCWAVDAASASQPATPGAPAADESRAARIAAVASAARSAMSPVEQDGFFAVVDQHAVLVAELAGNAHAGQILLHYWNDITRAASDTQAIEGFNQQLSQSYEEVNLVYRMAKLLTSNAGPIVSVQRMCDELRATLGYGWLALVLRTDDTVLEALRGLVLRSGDLPFDDSTLIAELTGFDPSQSGKVLTASGHPLSAKAGYELLIEPVLHNEATIGLLIAGDRRADVADISSNEIQLVSAAAGYLGLFHENAYRFAAQRAQFLGTLHALSATVDAKDPYTAGHSLRVGLLGSQLAAKIGLSAEQVETVRVSGLLHDIGKIGVPESILRKPARLDDDEFAQIAKHPEIGYAILKDIPSLDEHLPGVLHHHERWDGRGYPHKLAGENIPLIARILALADTFDAMSSNRAYRKGMERTKVFEEMRKSAGVQFDPALVEPFLSLDFTRFDELNK